MMTSLFASLLLRPRNVVDMMVGVPVDWQVVLGSPSTQNTKHRRIWYKFYLLAGPYA